MKRLFAITSLLLASTISFAAVADQASILPVPGPGPIYPTAVEGKIKVTHFFCIALVGVDCPPPRVELIEADGTTVTVNGTLANDLQAFDGKDVTLKGIRYGLPSMGGAPDVLDVDSFIVGHDKKDFITGTIHVSNNRNYPPDVYVEVNGRMMYIDNPYARVKLAKADGAQVTFEGEQTGPSHFRPTSNTFMVKGNVFARPIPLCLPGGPCGPFPTHGIELPNGQTIEIVDHNQLDNWFGRGETRWFELELDPSNPDLFTARSHSDVVYPAPVIDPWPWGPIVPFNDMGNNASRVADTNGGVRTSTGLPASTSSQGAGHMPMHGMRREQ